jgi:N-acetylmuramoyl-L-alanine amidase
VGIEIANMGAYGPEEKNPFADWYAPESNGRKRITIPARFGDGGIRTPGFVGHPARPEPITGELQGRALTQYDFTPEQYRALSHLTAALSKVLPRIRCDYPREPSGKVIPNKLPDDQLAAYQGVLGHFHIQTNKVDPGPAFNWDYVINESRRLLNGGFSSETERTSRGHLRN